MPELEVEQRYRSNTVELLIRCCREEESRHHHSLSPLAAPRILSLISWTQGRARKAAMGANAVHVRVEEESTVRALQTSRFARARGIFWRKITTKSIKYVDRPWHNADTHNGYLDIIIYRLLAVYALK